MLASELIQELKSLICGCGDTDVYLEFTKIDGRHLKIGSVFSDIIMHPNPEKGDGKLHELIVIGHEEIEVEKGKIERNRRKPNVDGIDLIDMKETMHISGMSRTSVYSLMSLGKFPRSKTIGRRKVVWIKSEIIQWVKDSIS